MNKKIILHIALFSMFSHMSAMNRVKGFLGMDKTYPCTLKKGVEEAIPSSITMLGSQKDLYPFCPKSVLEFAYNSKEDKATIGMNASDNRVDSFEIHGEAVQDLMNKLAKNTYVFIQGTDGKDIKILRLIGKPHTAAKKDALIYHTLNGSGNKYIKEVRAQLQGQYFQSSLECPSLWNPFGSIALKDNNSNVPGSLPLRQEAVQTLVNLLKEASDDGITLKIGSKNSVAPEHSFDKTDDYKVFLPKNNVLQVDNFLYRKQLVKYLLGGTSFMALIFAAMHYNLLSK